MIILDILFYIFIIVVCIQVIFNLFLFSNFSFSKENKTNSNQVPVSIIICAKNEADNLKEFLPSIICQHYPTFEIVLINDASNDDTLEVMESFSARYKNIRIVNVKNVEAFWGNKKYALTLGIKVAKYEYLLFTDADCRPVSEHWINEMSSQFNETKTIVLGYGAYNKIKKSILNKLIRYETLLTAMYYFSFAKIGLPYMGVGRNLAYKKSEFFNNNGFMSHIKIRSGDDDLFINQIATAQNTSICATKNSFTQSLPKTNFKEWLNQKRRHISTAKHYKVKHKILLSLLYITQLLFWVLASILFVFSFKWHIVLALFSSKLLIDYIILGFSAKKLNETDTILLLPFLQLFLLFIQLTIFISNLFLKPSHWK
jgi:glycosyltransferase involved in cell wall biosynthesis